MIHERLSLATCEPIELGAHPLNAISNLKTNPVSEAFADYSQPGHPVAAAIDGVTTNGGWAVDMPGLPMAALDRCAVFVTRDDIGYEDHFRDR